MEERVAARVAARVVVALALAIVVALALAANWRGRPSAAGKSEGRPSAASKSAASKSEGRLSAASKSEGRPTSLVVGGTARNCARYLPAVFARLDELALGFRVAYIFYESNSTDSTYAMLVAFVSAREGRVFTERTTGTRTDRIARGRNTVIAHVERSGADFFVNVDMDDRCTDIDVPSVRECLSRSAEWDVATSNRRVEYYDLWALRTPSLGNCWAPGDACYSHPLSDWFPADPELVGALTFPNTKERPYYGVMSAFAGLAIYKTSFLTGARYSGTQVAQVTQVAGSRNRLVDECEHAPFHRALAPGARIVVATYMYSGP
jgi:hypothetical protein